jgi:hypothetical protein
MAPQKRAHGDIAITMQHDLDIAYATRTKAIFTDFLVGLGPSEPQLLEEFEQLEDSELIKELELSQPDEYLPPEPALSPTLPPMLSDPNSEPIQFSRIISMPANEEMPKMLLLRLSDLFEYYQRIANVGLPAHPRGSDDNEEGGNDGLGIYSRREILRRLMRSALHEQRTW